MSVRVKVRFAEKNSTKVLELAAADSMDALFGAVAREFSLEPDSFSLLSGGQQPVPISRADSLQALHGSLVIVKQQLCASAKVVKSKSPRRKAKQVDSDSGSGSEIDDALLEEDDDVLPKRKSPTKSSSSPAKRSTSRSKIGTMKDIKAPKRPRQTIQSTEELGQVLASAQANERQDSVSKFFRRLTKNEVIRQYERTEADAKYAAALANDFTITPSEQASTYRLSEDEPLEVALQVTYGRGGRRKNGKESVMGMSEVLLREAVLSVVNDTDYHEDDQLEHPREGLRPHILPLVSPRVFWSLIHIKGGGTDCVENGLKSLLPQVDWSFLEHRVRKESQRAKNARHTEALFEEEEYIHRAEEEENAEEEEDGEEEEESDDELDDGSELYSIIPSRKDRDYLHESQGITTLLDLADSSTADQDWVELARNRCIETFFLKLISMDGGDPSLAAKLAGIDLKTPADLERLRVPGRMEFVQRELDVSKNTVEQWQQRAVALIQQHSWLTDYRTRG